MSFNLTSPGRVSLISDAARESRGMASMSKIIDITGQRLGRPKNFSAATSCGPRDEEESTDQTETNEPEQSLKPTLVAAKG
jgi:hypothetical protein